MSEAKILAGLQRELRTFASGCLVLLGGSYFHGHATPASDVDFYLIGTWRQCWRVWRRRAFLRQWKQQKIPLLVNIMLVPRFFYHRGWFYVAGRAAGGKKYTSPWRRALVARTASKLSAFYGLKFLRGQDAGWQRKASQQLRILSAAQNDDIDFLATSPLTPIWSVKSLLDTAASVDFQRFYWANYWLYNLKFLPKLNFTFLFCNPDKKIWHYLRTGLQFGGIDAARMRWLEKYVFPTVII